MSEGLLVAGFEEDLCTSLLVSMGATGAGQRWTLPLVTRYYSAQVPCSPHLLPASLPPTQATVLALRHASDLVRVEQVLGEWLHNPPCMLLLVAVGGALPAEEEPLWREWSIKYFIELICVEEHLPAPIPQARGPLAAGMETAGRERLIEALECHPWPPSTQQRTRGEEEEEEEEDESPEEFASLMDRVSGAHAAAKAGLDDGERRERAAQIALQMLRSFGLSDGESDDESTPPSRTSGA